MQPIIRSEQKTSVDRLLEYLEEVQPKLENQLTNLYGSFSTLEKGKKLRGCLCVLVNRSLGGRERRAVFYGALVELIHAGTLLQDDWLDNHLVRRDSVPYYIFSGPKRAVLEAEKMFTLALREAAVLGKDEAEEVATCLHEVLEGVLKEDLSFLLETAINDISSLPSYTSLVKEKTGRLFACATHLGQLSCQEKISPAQRHAWERYGRCVGAAYQMVDDLVEVQAAAAGEMSLTQLPAFTLTAFTHYPEKFVSKWLDPTEWSGDTSGSSAVLKEMAEKLRPKLRRKAAKMITKAQSAVDSLRLRDDYSGLLKAYPLLATRKMKEEEELLP